MLGYKAAKDRLNLLFGDSASNNLKLKRLLVYHSKNLRALKDIAKGSLPAVWKSNPKTWVRRAIFQNQFFHHFNLEIEKFAWRRTFHSAFFCCSTVLWATPFMDNFYSNIKIVICQEILHCLSNLWTKEL